MSAPKSRETIEKTSSSMLEVAPAGGRDAAARIFPGGGEMGRRLRAFDWSATPLGPVASWPQSLRTAVRIILDSRYPMFIWWGRELINIYNDAYIDILGARHPAALGRPAQDTWGDIWDAIGPLVETVVEENRATFNAEMELFMARSGYLEETFFTFSYSPIADPERGVLGLFCACIEDTKRVVGERRMQLIRRIGAITAEADTVDGACALIADAIAEHDRDISFALLYLLEQPDGGSARLGAHVGIPPGHALAPERVALEPEGDAGPAVWQLAGALHGEAQIARDLGADLSLPGGAWPEPAEAAMTLPLAHSRHHQPLGLLIVGAGPRRAFDDDYRAFFELLAGGVASAIANARAYEEERKRADTLAELDRAKTVFFGNVSHEFRTPLTLMLAPLEELVGAPGVAPEQRRQLAIAQRNGLRLLKLVNTLLDFSRIEAGRIDASYQPTDLAVVTEELASMFRSAVDRAGLSLEVDCPPLGEPVWVDRDMWEKIVLNLISNALKYTHEGTIAVRLTTDDDGRAARLEVRDTGIGIPADQMPHLFERFYRVPGARGRTQEGTGIGLALVRQLAALHGGTVRAESEPGRGSAFIVTVPLGHGHLPSDQVHAQPSSSTAPLGAAPFVEEALRWLPDHHDSAITDTSAEIPLSRSGPGRGHDQPHILIADDNADMREYLRRLMSSRYDVLAVADGEAALAAIEARTPDLVLCDVMMPKLDGFGLLARLRNDPATIGLPVMLLSARAGEEARAEGLEAGANDYLVKPFFARELLARVGAQLELAEARRESEARLRLALEAGELAHWELDLSDGTVSRSERHDAIFGYPELQPVWTLETSMAHVHEDDRAEVEATIERAIAADGDWDLETRIVRTDGAVRWVWVVGHKVENADGEAERMIGVVKDITEQKRTEETLRDVDRRKDEFLATLAHELRNPLAPIGMALNLLRDPRAGERADELYAMIGRQVEQLTRLVDDLMEVSRITRGKIELRKSAVTLQEVVAGAVETSKPLLEARGHRLDVSLPEDPVHLEADAVRLAQALTNLLNNAAKYTADGGRIAIAARRGDGDYDGGGENVEIAVRDNGIGIPREELSHVFEPFRQAGRLSGRAQSGLGLGLTLVRDLIERHGGTVEAHSEGEGRGSEFRIVLPVAAAPERARDDDGDGTRAAASRPRRILIVDDNRDAADSLALLLGTRGHETCTRYHGDEVLEAVASFAPEVLLLDLGLPGMDGYQLARELRARDEKRQTVLIAITGWGHDSDRARSREAGFDHHLVKPVDWSTLQTLIEEHP